MRFSNGLPWAVLGIPLVVAGMALAQHRGLPESPPLARPLQPSNPIPAPRELDPHEALRVRALQVDPPKKDDPPPRFSDGGASPEADSSTIFVAINQRFFIRPNGLKGNLSKKDLSFDRPDILGFEDLKDKEQLFFTVREKDAIFFARKLGIVRITYHPEEGEPQVFTVNVRPDVAYLNRLLRDRFPTAKLNVVATGDNTVLLDGVVESPGDSFAAENILKLFKLGVVNNSRVGGVMQVQLDVVIVRVDRLELRRLGINSLISDTRVGGGSTIGNLVNTPAFNLPNAANTASGASTFNPISGMGPALVQGGTNPANLFFGVTDSSRGWFNFIEALRQNNAATILANPTLVAYNGRTADFLVGGRQPIPTSGSLGVPNVTFETFGTRLTFLPTMLGEGKIRLEVVPEVSNVDFTNSIAVGGVQVPSFVVQRLHATVEMQSSQTLCMGGLLQTQIDSQSEKVPLLGDLPGVGPLFRRVRHRTRETELLILVTPRLVEPLQNSQAPKQLPGQEFGIPNDAQFYLNGQLEVRRDDCDIAPPVVGDRISDSVAPGNRGSSFATQRGTPAPPVFVVPAPAIELPVPKPQVMDGEARSRYRARGQAPEVEPVAAPFLELFRHHTPDGYLWR